MKRDVFTMQLPLGHELAIDNFAGGGGASTGIALGLGREIDIAINHDGEALAMHTANHPTAAHYTEDVFAVHPGFVTRQLPIGLAWFSPDCKHFSKAKGSKPVDKKIRGLAWVTLKWATFQAPRVIMLENVEEFQDWGPVGDDNKPIKAEKGRTFRAFIGVLTTGIPADHPDLEEIYTVLGHDFPIERLHKGLGYQVEWKVLRACDFGTPTIRKRLFLVARRDGRPIVWPAATHGDPKSEAVRKGKLQPWRTAAECIDWSIPCPSIFERKRPLKDATLRRIAKGIMKYVVNSADPFIVGAGGPIYGGKPADIAKPFGTLTTENHRALVQPIFAPVMTEHANASSPRCMPADEPLRTICAQVKGGHHALVAAHITKFRANSVGSGADEPLHTITAGGECQRPAGAAHAMGVVTAFLAKHYGGVVGIPADAPTGTVTATDHHSIVTAQLVGCGGRAGQSRPRDAGEPAATITSKADTAVVRATLMRKETTHECNASDQEGNRAGTDRGRLERRCLEAGEFESLRAHHAGLPPASGVQPEERILRYQGGTGWEAILNACPQGGLDAVQGRNTGRNGPESHGRRQDQQQSGQPRIGNTEPESSACVSNEAPRAGNTAHSGETCRGSAHPQDTGPFLQRDREAPGHFTVYSIPCGAERVKAFLISYYRTDQNPGLEKPLPTVTTKDRIGLVTIRGEEYAIVDIGMRMLTPRELARAQGFPDSYILDPVVNGKPLPKSSQVRMIGNSVCPPMAKALVEANFAHERSVQKAA
ncbi:MAG TPA: DNA cytosine methyltransferase [Noviherbaspirillum sp.]|nr:DNA cytosine methyltransferase [Noviherbaspirillum sp.]HYD97046.1 DNA cytosine methyltransferase [Noviherbaspirillum sp.]